MGEHADKDAGVLCAAVYAGLDRYRREHDRYLRLADHLGSRCRALVRPGIDVTLVATYRTGE